VSRYRDRHDHGVWGEIVEGYHQTASADYDNPARLRAGSPPAS
jgi:hypothetical protein